MASQRTKCWRPEQNAPRVTELSLWSEEDFLIVQRLRQKYNCSKLPYKTEWPRSCSYPVSKTAVPHLPTEEVQIKREPLTPMSSFQLQCPQQASLAPVTPTHFRHLLDSGDQPWGHTPALWPVSTITDSKPAVGSQKKREHRNLPFFPPSPHANSQSSDQRTDAEASGAEYNQRKETFSPHNFFLSHTKEKSPFLKSSMDPGAMWKHKRDAKGTSWNAKDQLSCSGQQISGSGLSPNSRKKDSLQNHERCHLTIDSSDDPTIEQNWMPFFSKYFSTDKRSGQELTSREATKTSSLLSGKNLQCTLSSDDHCKPMLDLSGKKNCTVTSAAGVSAYGISPVEKKHKRKPEPGWKTPPHVQSQTQRYAASTAGFFLEPSTQRRDDGPSPVSTALNIQSALSTGLFSTSHTAKQRRHGEVSSLAGVNTDSCTDKRDGSKLAVQHKRSEKRSVAQPKASTSAGKEASREKNQRTLTSYSGIVKRKKTSAERGAHVKQVEEGIEDPVSRVISSPQRTCEEVAAGEGSESGKRAGSERQGVRDITAMTSQHRHQLASSLQSCPLIGCLVLYEDGTTNTDCSLFTRPQVEGVLLHCKEESYMFPVPQRCQDAATNQWVRGALKGVLRKEETVKVAINCKHFVISLLRDFSLGGHREAVEWRFQDPLVGGWLLKPDHPPHSLHHLCRSFHLHHTQEGGPDRDLQASVAVMEKVKVSLQEQKVWALFLQVEMPLCPLLAAMELQPLRVNVHTLRAFSLLLRKKMEEVEKQAHQVAGHPFCINSTLQLRQLLYEELRLDQQLPGSRRVTLTASAQHKSTSEAVLKQLVPFHPLPALVLEYRHLCKLKSTYIEGILECVEEGVVHTHWDQTSAATGRLVSAHPNLQAFPKTPTTITDCQDDRFIVGAEAKSCEIYAREPFIANDGHVFLAADFQQIELRLLAHLARDPALRDMFRADLQSADIFIRLTALWLSKAYADVSHSEREQTKRVVYSIMYGVGKERLAEYLKVSSSRAKDVMDSFLVSFPAIQMFTRKCVDYAQKHGYTETVMGRRRWLAAVQDRAAPVRAQAQAQRQAVNFCLQGSAADLCKRAMVRVEQALRAKPHLTARLLMHIHDELVWELPQDQLKEMCEVVKGVMEDDGSLCRPLLPGLSVALSVSLSSGTSWAHLKPWP